MQIDIITIFPNMFDNVFGESIIGRAKENKSINLNVHDLRKWTTDKRKTVDDNPYGGGPGMVMMVEPFYKAINDIKSKDKNSNSHIILTSAKGSEYSQKKAEQYKSLDQLIILCGHYEGVDERVAEHLADEEISIGKYVLTGGEIPAMVISDSVIRLIPGVLGNKDSLLTESHSTNTDKEYPQYTRPADFTLDNGDTWSVPDTLLSGNHKQIEQWRNMKAR